MNTIKEQRSGVEDRMLEDMQRIEELDAEIAALDLQLEERRKVREQANSDLQTAATTPEPATTPASTEQLQSVVETNLASLNQSVDGDFEANIGQFGDLNNDGIDDAVVLFDYQSSTADFTQFVAAYLFNGENYHLAATKPVGGTDLAVRKVEVEGIANGSIQLRLVLNDSSQTEDRRAAMILKDGQLVETE